MAVQVLCAALIVLAVVPFTPAALGDGLDSSWEQALYVAFQRGYQFGSEIVFTFGPLGFTYTRLYWPDLFAITLIYWLVAAAGIVWMYRSMTARLPFSPVVPWVSWAACVLTGALISPDALILGFFLLLVWYGYAAEPTVRGICALAAAAAFLGLSKFTFMIAGAVAIAALLPLFMLGGKPAHALAALIAFGVALVTGWIGADQSLRGLGTFISTGWELARGYDAGMGLAGPATETWTFVALAVVVLGVPAARIARTRDRVAMVPVMASLVIMAMVFMQSFTRHDAHAVLAFVFLGFEAVLLGFFASPRPGHWNIAWAALLVALAFASSVYAMHRNLGWGVGFVLRNLAAIPGRALQSSTDLLAGAPQARKRFETGQAAIRQSHPLPPLKGTVDIYSYGQAEVFAHRLNWHPRPVFQSYAAYTPRLAALNAAHVSGADAPQHLLFAIEPIDGRWAALEDGASWVPILQRYTLAREGPLLLLDRTDEGMQPVQSRPLRRLQGTGWQAVPDAKGNVTTASIHVRQPMVARMASFLAGPRIYFIEMRLANFETVRRYRFIPGAAEMPIVLSPLVASTADFAGLFKQCPGNPPLNQVREVRIVDAEGRDVPFTIDLNDVELKPRASRSASGPLRQMACELHLVEAVDAVRVQPFIFEPAGSGLNAHPPSTFRVLVPASELEVCTRLRHEAMLPGRSDGYIVQIVRNATTAPEVVASREVRPDDIQTQKGAFCLSAKLPKREADVEIRVLPGATNAWDWVYITSFTARE